MKKSILNYLFAVLICIPLFFINSKSWQDWGDDFAQYIHQSLNLVKGISQKDTGYIFNADFPMYAPAAYPAGFPIILAPVIKWKGLSIHHLTLYISFFLACYGILIFGFLKRFYTPAISLMLVLIFIYNPWTLSFKGDIVSDIPFAVFLLMITMMFLSWKNRNLGRLLLLSFLTAFTILIRSVGIVFPIAVICFALYEYLKNRKSLQSEIKREIYFSLKLIALTLLFFFVLNRFIFPTSSDAFNYKLLIDFHQLKSIIQTNLNYYTGVFRAFFEPWNDHWNFVSIISASMIFTFIILGIVKKIISNFDFTDILFFVYLAVIVIYPYSNAGFRFLFPLIPFFIYYLMKGILSVDVGIKTNTFKLSIALTLIVLFSYKKGITEVYKTENIITEGPQVPENKEMFEYIILNTNPDARFSFKRPRALALYANRKCMTHRKEAGTSEIENNLLSNEINYLLVNTEDVDQNVLDYIKEKNLKKIWSNSINTIYFLK